MAGKDQYKAQEFITVIPGTGGVIDTIAKRVGCDWHTAKKYIEDHPTVKQAYENEKSRVDDAARSVVISNIVTDKNVDTAKWWLRVKLPDEFAPTQKVDAKTEVTGAGGAPLIDNDRYDRAISGLADAIREIVPGKGTESDGSVGSSE